ncbi:MAG TPA: hypothetical protein VF708_19475 [Pyrinomonadaceae bacterium]
MNCKACRIEIEESETSRSLSVEARHHTETCLPCRALRDEHLALTQLVGSLEPVAAPSDFDLRLRARLAATAGRDQRRSAWLRLAPGGVFSLAGGAAICLLLLMLAAVVYRQVSLTGSENMRPTGVVSKGELKTDGSQAGSKDATQTPNRTEDYLATGGATGVRNHASGGSPAVGGATSSSPRVLRSGALSAAAKRDVVASGAEKIISSDSAVYNPPPLITPTAVYNPAVDPVPSIALPVRSSAQPMAFFLKGWGGASRTVPLKLVTFGSEMLIEQSEETRAGALDASDIW